MAAIDWIVDSLNSISDYFYQLYLDCYFAGFPLEYLANWFYQLCKLFNTLAWDFYYLGDWIRYVDEKVRYVLTQADILAYFEWFITAAENAWDWVSNATRNVQNIINTWWASVGAWWETQLAELRTEFNEFKALWTFYWAAQIEDLITNLTAFRSDWDYFWTVLYPKSVSWNALLTWWNTELLELQGLINSAFSIRSSLWEGWQELRDKVTEFITDPQQWFYDRLEEIFERFW